MQLILNSYPKNKETINCTVFNRFQNNFRRAFSAANTSIMRSKSKSRTQEFSIEIVVKEVNLASIIVDQ